MEKKQEELSLVQSTILFLDVFIAFLIITTATFLIKTDFGEITLIFSFATISLVTLLRLNKIW